MVAVTGQPAPAGMLSLSHPLSSSHHTVYVSVINVSSTKDTHRWSRQRRKARTSTLSSLVEANTKAVPSLSEGINGSSRGNNNAIQSTAGVTGAGGVALLTAAGRKSLAEDMQAEARAMARAASASTYSPEMIATKYGSRPFTVEMDNLLFDPILFFALLYFFGKSYVELCL